MEVGVTGEEEDGFALMVFHHGGFVNGDGAFVIFGRQGLTVCCSEIQIDVTDGENGRFALIQRFRPKGLFTKEFAEGDYFLAEVVEGHNILAVFPVHRDILAEQSVNVNPIRGTFGIGRRRRY